MNKSMLQDSMKAQSARATVAYLLKHGTTESVVGIGTGSTVNIFLEYFSQYADRFSRIVSSSIGTSKRLDQLNIQHTSLDQIDHIDFYVDGADFVDNELRMIKGGGGALVREKILASMSKNFLCMVDASKCCDFFSNQMLPIEVLPFAKQSVEFHLKNDFGFSFQKREDFISDNNHIIYDLTQVDYEQDLQQLELNLNQIPGVVDNGLFCFYPATHLFVGEELSEY